MKATAHQKILASLCYRDSAKDSTVPGPVADKRDEVRPVSPPTLNRNETLNELVAVDSNDTWNDIVHLT